MAPKVSLSFRKSDDFELDIFAQGVMDAITGNAALPTPPVAIENLNLRTSIKRMVISLSTSGSLRSDGERK